MVTAAMKLKDAYSLEEKVLWSKYGEKRIKSLEALGQQPLADV